MVRKCIVVPYPNARRFEDRPMPLQPSMKLLSVDDHLIEPPHVWTDRLPKKYLEQ